VAGHWLAAELLCNAGTDVNIRCNAQRSESWNGTGNLLHLAASYGNNRFFNFLLDQGIEVNATGSTGLTPLHIAAKNGDEDMTKKLLQREAKINAVDEEGRTPLYVACVEKRESIIRLLENNGALEGGVVCDEDSAEACR
jgi:ankyrin repeat protein